MPVLLQILGCNRSTSMHPRSMDFERVTQGADMERQSLACMEVWGGNTATFSAFEKAGLDIWLYSQPFGNHPKGGDVYYLSSCASGRISRMLLADVAGHGEDASQVAVQLRKLMRRYINTIRPHKLFEEINAAYSHASPGDRFATSIVNSYFMPTSLLSICNAGHPTPMLREARTGRWKPLEIEDRTEDIPFGIADKAKYTQLDIPVQVGDMVLCYTDGVIESRNSSGTQLGIPGLQKLLSTLPADWPERILPELVKQIAERNSGGFHEDDVTILLYRITNRAVPMRDNLAAPLRWLRSLFEKD
jgi:serine phosphatase RsbU (regulator of sigma subunit)